MPACERCWADSGGDADEYRRTLDRRVGTNRCTPEQQAGPNATKCVRCRNLTAHQYCRVCMLCGYDNSDNGRHQPDHTAGPPSGTGGGAAPKDGTTP